jgi:thymidine kinase
MQNTAWHGSIEVICGSMFSGKTEELIRRMKRAQYAKQKVQLFKPIIDDRFGVEHVQSHNASRAIAKPIKSSQELLAELEPNTRVVGIDEAQFFDSQIIKVVQDLAYRGIRVVLAGLDMDFKGEPFGPMPQLLAIAEEVTKLSAICVVCSAPATRSQRVSTFNNRQDDNKQVLVGASDHYEARCRMCHEPVCIVRNGDLPGILTDHSVHGLEAATKKSQ